jgi:hypothetical protein
MRRRTWLGSTLLPRAVLVSALLTASGGAWAQDVSDVPSTVGPSLATGGVITDFQPYWSAGKPRWFAAATFDAGAIFFRPELNLGWGKPHYAWGGLELSPQLSLAGVSTFTGAKFVVPGFMLRAGGRYNVWSNRRLLEPRETYTREQIELGGNPSSKYFMLDAEMTFDVPLPVGTLVSVGSLHYLGGIPEPFNVFEQSLRLVVKPPLVWRSRTAYLLGLGTYDTARIGGMFEMLGSPARDEVMMRVGPAFAVALTHHLQATVVAAFPIMSKDGIGLESADFGQVSLSYRWATGDRWPEFP